VNNFIKASLDIPIHFGKELHCKNVNNVINVILDIPIHFCKHLHIQHGKIAWYFFGKIVKKYSAYKRIFLDCSTIRKAK
jgi:hypothetical protein